MPRSNPLRHAREAWGQVHNPFPAAAIGGEDLTNGAAPYDGEVLGEDREQFLEKIIVNAVLPPGREFGYLWSQGRKDDTGYGKTRLMLETRRELNRDFGAGLVKEYDLLSDTAIAAVWASMKTTGITGIYPLLFDAIVDAAKRTTETEASLIERCWQVIARRTGVDPEDADTLSREVRRGIRATRRLLFPGYPELREDITSALASCNRDVLLSGLEGVTHVSRTRNGLAYFEAFHCLTQAAGIGHLFVFIDQLEDLATATNIPRKTRQREVGRFRDIFAETAGFRGRCHAVFTLHRRAASALTDFWHLERINPPFEPAHPVGRSATVVLHGLTTTRQVERVLAVYLDSVRAKPSGTADPFDPSAFQILLEHCEGRIGQLLPEASALWQRAAEAQLPSITAQFIAENPVAPEETPSLDRVSDDDTLEALWNR